MSNLIKITDKSPLVHIIKKINGEKVTIKTYLNAEDYLSAIRTIAETCFDDEGVYKPEYFELAWRYVVLKYFTDIELGETSVEEVFKVTQADWYYDVETTCDKYSYYFDVKKAAKELIDYRISTRKSSFDLLCDALKEIAESSKIDESAVEQLKDISDKLSKIDQKAIAQEVVKASVKKAKKK